MYRLLKSFLVVFSLGLLSFLTVSYISGRAAYFPTGKTAVVEVVKARIDILEEIKQISFKNHVIIAKELFTSGTNTTTGATKATFTSIGYGKLSNVYPQTTDKTLINGSPNTTNYLIIGNHLSAKSLSEQLNKLGNTTSYQNEDIRLDMLTFELPNNDLTLIIVLLISFITLLMGKYISEIKYDSVRRLAGMSKKELLFSAVKQDSLFILSSFVIFTVLSSVYLALTGIFSITYFETIFITLFVWTALLLIVDFLISFILFYLLQAQAINLSIKGKTPLLSIVILVFVLQIVAVIGTMSSLSGLEKTINDLNTLKQGQNAWAKNKNYYGTTALGNMTNSSNNKVSQENLKNFLTKILNAPTTLLATNYFDYLSLSESTHERMNIGYSPTPPSNISPMNYVANALYVNATFVKQSNLEISASTKNAISQMGAGKYCLLVPESQKNNLSEFSMAWQQTESEYNINQATAAVYKGNDDLFTYAVIGNSTVSNQTLAHSPVLIVYSPKTFTDTTNFNVLFGSYLSMSQILTTNPEMFNQLVKQYHLEFDVGTLINGYLAINNRIFTTTVQRNMLLFTNGLNIVSALLLIYLLNTIYFYQNRKKFLIRRLAGHDSLEIHSNYLWSAVIMCIVIVDLAYFLFHLSLSSLVIPMIYLLLVFSLFAVQVRRERRANVLYLKGL